MSYTSAPINTLEPPAEPTNQAGLLAPRSLWRLFTQTARLYRRAWVEYLALAGVGYGLLLLVTGLLGLLSQLLPAANNPLLTAVAGWSGLILLAALAVLVHAALTAAFSYALADKILARPFSLSRTLRRVWQHQPALLSVFSLSLLLALLIIAAGGIPLLGWLVAPGLLVTLLLFLFLTPPIIVFERAPAPWAIARAWRLTRQQFTRTLSRLLALLLLGLLWLGLPTLLMLLLGLPFQRSDLWLPLLLGTFYVPFQAAGLTLIYFDLRARTEPLSPELLASAIDGPPLRPPAQGLRETYTVTGRGGLFTLAEVGKFAIVSLGVWSVAGLLAWGGWYLLVEMPAQQEAIVEEQTIGTAAPEFALAGLDGQPVTLAAVQGQPAIINFWATWCRPCQEELPALEAAYADYGAEINFLAVSVNETEAEVAPFAADYALSLPIALDSNGAMAADYQVRGLPTTVFLDANGVIVNRHLGPLTPATLAGYMQDLLPD